MTRYVAEYERKFPVYLKLHETLKTNGDEFLALEMQYDAASGAAKQVRAPCTASSVGSAVITPPVNLESMSHVTYRLSKLGFQANGAEVKRRCRTSKTHYFEPGEKSLRQFGQPCDPVQAAPLSALVQLQDA